MPVIWNEEDVAKLTSFAQQGMSARQAASQFDNMTRNAAVGIAHRKGFHFHSCNKGGPRRISGDRGPRRRPGKPPEIVEPRIGLLTIYELAIDSCRWPLGDPLQTDFRYCGQKSWGEKPYCPEHCGLAFETPDQRRARIQP